MKKLKAYKYAGMINEEGRWFLRWLTLRRINKELEFENGQLKSELDHLNYLISVYKKQKQ